MASERWHPDQVGRMLEDGGYELKVPYSDDRELIMDIMRYGGDCEVVEPEALRGRVTEELRKGHARYGD